MFIKIKMFHLYKKSRGLANFSSEKYLLFILLSIIIYVENKKYK